MCFFKVKLFEAYNLYRRVIGFLIPRKQNCFLQKNKISLNTNFRDKYYTLLTFITKIRALLPHLDNDFMGLSCFRSPSSSYRPFTPPPPRCSCCFLHCKVLYNKTIFNWVQKLLGAKQNKSNFIR